MARRIRVTAALLLALVGLGACSRADTGADTPGADLSPAAELRLGYFPNVTHAPAIIGVDKGFIPGELGSTKLTTQQFNAGGEAVNALLGGSLDATFIGSGPAINAFAKSGGKVVRLVAGATEGGAQLVVRPGITGPEQLAGRTVATPQKGNTQDIAFKKWLQEHNLTDGAGPAAVSIANLDNPRTLDAYRQGSLDGGWLPEPWASRLVLDAGATVLLDEKTLWPGGRFPTTVLLVRTDYLAEHPDTVRALIRGHLKALDFAAAHPAEAKTVVNDGLEKLTRNRLSPAVLDRAFAGITLGPDPLAATFPQLAKDSVTAGIVEQETDLRGLLDVSLLNAELGAAGTPAVDAAGLDKPQG